MPQQWQPPTAPVDNQEEWKPPSQAIDILPSVEDRKKFISNTWNKMNEPLAKFGSPQALEQFSTEHPYLSAIPKFTANVLESMSSPLSLGLGALTGGAGLAEKFGLGQLAEAMHLPGKIAAGGMAAHGAYKTATESTLAGKVGGLTESGLGLMGLRGNLRNITSEEPNFKTTNLPPEFTAVGEENVGKLPQKDPAQLAYELAQKKFGMGLTPEQAAEFGQGKVAYDAATKGTAKFKGYQPTAEGKMMPLYDIEGGPLHKSTVSIDTLNKQGIPVPETPPYVNPVDKLKTALSQAEPIREEQAKLYTTERGKRMAEAEKVGGEGKEWAKKYLGAQAGELPKVDFESLKLDEGDVRQLFNQIRNSAKLTGFEKNHAITGLMKITGEYGGAVPQRNELDALGRVFGNDLAESLRARGSKPISGMLAQGTNFTKTIMSSYDLSAPLRQGVGLIHRPEYWGAFNDMFRAAGSEKYFNSINETIRAKPTFELGQQSGLALTDLSKGLANREEAFLSTLAEKIPGVRPSERAYTGFLNKLRADTFESLVESAKAAGRDPNKDLPLAREIAGYVNTATGRGSLGALEKHAVGLNNLLFSPRLIASRMTILNPMYYYNADPLVRKEALKTLFAIAGAGATTATLGKMAGGSVETNLTSADFGKVKIGNTRLDPYGGFQQYVVAASRLIGNETTSSTTGRTTDMSKSQFGRPTRLDIVGRFAESKANPMVSFLTTMLRGKDFTGKPVNVPNEIASRVIPMYMQDVYDLAKDDPKLLPLAIPAGFGMGLQTYGR